MKKRKLLKVRSIKRLNRTKNSQGVESADRVSLYEDRENFCIYSLKPGETVVESNGVITQVGSIKVGEEVIAIEEDITTNDGQSVKQFYFLTSDKLEDYVNRAVARDVNLAIDAKTALVRAQHAKQLAEFDLEGAMKTV